MKSVISILILLFSSAAYSQQQTATVLGNMKLRGTPASAGKVVSEISRDSLVEILLTRDDWHLVQAGDYAGWVRVGTVVLHVSSESLYPKQPDVLSTPPQVPPPLNPGAAAALPFELAPQRVYSRDSRGRCYYINPSKKRVYVKVSFCR